MGVPGGGSPGLGARWKLGAVGARPASGAGARSEGSAGFAFPRELRRPARLARGPLPACDARASAPGENALFLQKGPLRFCNRSPLHSAPCASSMPASGGGGGARGAGSVRGAGPVRTRRGADARRRPGGEKSRHGGPAATAAPARSRHPLAEASPPPCSGLLARHVGASGAPCLSRPRVGEKTGVGPYVRALGLRARSAVRSGRAGGFGAAPRSVRPP